MMIQLTYDVYLDEILYECGHCQSALVSHLVYKLEKMCYCSHCHRALDPNPLNLFKSKLNRMSYHFHGQEKTNEIKKEA
jgi:hypothetical protein